MRGTSASYLLAVTAVVIVAAVTSVWLQLLGTASAALLFLLPVLLVAPRGGVGPALTAAAGGALAYNFFLLPPRFTFRVHGLDNLVSVFVLFAVALVMSRLATALKTREAEAEARASANAAAAEFSALLGKGEPLDAVDNALAWLGRDYGEARIVAFDRFSEQEETGFSTLDLSAAAWAMHNGDRTGHGTAIMPAAEWTFLPMSLRHRASTDLLALARPAGGETRNELELTQVQALARLLGQARDRSALDEARRERERLEDRDAFRRTLLASLAHDFRTPLTVVTGELAKLADTDEGAAQALMAARRLDRMMDDLVGAARIESGALSPRSEATDLIDIVADVREALGEIPASIRLVQQVGATLPLIKADPVLLRHILINLIDNAIRHARSTVEIGARAAGQSVEIIVRDDGPGIPADDRARIFERFARVEGGDRSGGSGLGLAIARGFADAMGMTIAAEEEGGGGGRFRLAVPAWKTDLR